MSVAAAQGYPQLKDMGVIGEVYADQFNVDYRENTCIPKVTTGKFYEGLLSKGDKVTLANLPDMEFHTGYTKGQTISPDYPEPTKVEMTVNRAGYFMVGIDAVDMKQTHIKSIRAKYLDKLRHAVRKAVETEFWAAVKTEAHADNIGITAGADSGNIDMGAAGDLRAVSSSNVMDFYTEARQVLAEKDADHVTEGSLNPDDDFLWMVGPPSLRTALMKSDLANASWSGKSKSVFLTGTQDLDVIDGFHTYISRLLPANYVFFGNKDAISYISQLNEVAFIPSKSDPTGFVNKLKGLFVYDWKVRKPEGLGVAQVSIS